MYHKRRIDWNKYSVQVNKFGKARPILNSWYPEYGKLTFYLPTLFIIGFLVAVFLLLHGITWPTLCFGLYFFVVFVLSAFENKSIKIGFFTLIAVYKQFTGYGIGFLKSYIKVIVLKQKPETAFPELFFKIKS